MAKSKVDNRLAPANVKMLIQLKEGDDNEVWTCYLRKTLGKDDKSVVLEEARTLARLENRSKIDLCFTKESAS